MISLLKKRGRRVPEDYSLIGFDNLALSALSAPALTTIAQNISLKARYAVDTLFRYLEDSSLPSRNVVLDVDLVELVRAVHHFPHIGSGCFPEK